MSKTNNENITYFMKDGIEHRILGRFTKEKEPGYAEANEVMDNLVQMKQKGLIFSRWKTIETERVPACAWIAVGTLGSTDWRSALIAKYKPFIDASNTAPAVDALSGPGLGN